MFPLIVRTIRFANLLLTSLIAGMSFSRVLNSSVTRLPARVRIEYQQALDRDVAPVMGLLGPLVILTNAANVLSLARSYRSPAFTSALGGLLGVTLFAVVTVRVDVPINEELHSWSRGVSITRTISPAKTIKRYQGRYLFVVRSSLWQM